jgi:hypothetical protein
LFLFKLLGEESLKNNDLSKCCMNIFATLEEFINECHSQSVTSHP